VNFDYAIVGGGILGTSIASALLRRGQTVVLFDRFTRPSDGSTRNFGLVWPHIMPKPEWIPFGLRTLELYQELAGKFEFGFTKCGVLLVAENRVESAVLEEFAIQAAGLGLHARVIAPHDSVGLHPLLRQENIRLSLQLPEGGSVDPRRMVAGWLDWMSAREGLDYRPSTTVVHLRETPGQCTVTTASGTTVSTRNIVVCAGEDFQTLLPDLFRASGLKRCRLHMYQTAPLGVSPQSPGLAFGRSLQHYRLFSNCPSFSRLKAEPTDATLDALGIHFLAKASADRSLILGDSHEDTTTDAPRDYDYESSIEQLLMKEGERHLRLEGVTIRRRWLGYYARHAEAPIVELQPTPQIRVLSGLTVGMSGGPGLMESRVRCWLE
jgi:FAD dependent oxidoreductase TIGR03364